MAKAQQINPEKARWLEVLGIAMPLCLSYVPIGVACGILLHAAGFNFIMTLIVSIVVFSGGAQFILASLLTIHAPLTSIFVTLFFLELRYALLGSSLSKYIKSESQHFIWLFAVSRNDENYAVNYLKFATDKKWKPKDALLVEHYSLLSWSVSNMVGGLIGSTISINLEVVDFALTALFIYMIVMQMRSHLTLIICLLSAVLAVFFMVITHSIIGVVIATLIASFIGFLIEMLFGSIQRSLMTIGSFLNYSGRGLPELRLRIKRLKKNRFLKKRKSRQRNGRLIHSHLNQVSMINWRQ